MEFDLVDVLEPGDQIDVLIKTIWWSGVFQGKNDLRFWMDAGDGATSSFNRDDVVKVRRVENKNLEPLDAVYLNLRTMIREMETL